MNCADCPVPREVCEAGCDCPAPQAKGEPAKYVCPNQDWRCEDCIELERGCYSPARQQTLLQELRSIRALGKKGWYATAMMRIEKLLIAVEQKEG